MMIDHVTNRLTETDFNDRLDALVKTNAVTWRVIRVIKIDINRFSHHIAHLGVAGASYLLDEISQRLDRLPDVMMFCRSDFDRFYLQGTEHLSIETIAGVFQSPFIINGASILVNATIGYTDQPLKTAHATSLVIESSIAVSQAKEFIEPQPPHPFRRDLVMKLRRERLIEIGLAEAIGTKQFYLEYQPKFDASSNRIVGLEGLLRWNHPSIGFIPPAEFIPIAEAAGLIEPLTRHTVELAVADHLGWQSSSFDAPAIAINLSPLAMRSHQIKSLLSFLTETASPMMIEIEITEGALSDETLSAAVTQLSELGFNISIDDFGQDRSNLWRLSHLPVGALKLDKSLVDRIVHDRRSLAIVRMIIELASELGMTTIAEGVETSAQLKLLRVFGCHTVQGFLLGRPLPSTEIPFLLERNRALYGIE